MSIYKDELTDEVLAKQVGSILKSFPKLPPHYYDVLIDRFKENGFTNQRLKDAVGYVIDNCPYPEPAIANFISFDKKIKLYTYNDICKMCDENKSAFDYYQAVEVGQNYPMWASKLDVERYKLTIYKNERRKDTSTRSQI